MRLELISDAAGLSALQPAWSTLLGHAADANTFLSPEWLLAWWESYQPAATIQALAAYEGENLVGLAPMMVMRESRLGLPVRCLRFIGDGTYETDHMNFVVTRETATEVRKTLLDGIAKLPWDVAVLSNVPESSGAVQDVGAWAAGHGFSSSTVFTPGPVRTLPDTFEAVLASMPSRFRTSVRSTRRKLATGYRVEFGLHQEPEELDSALDALFTNHESRWRARGQSGVFVNDKRRQFYRQLSRRLLAAGSLRFFFLKLDGRIVAQEYCFQHAGTVYLLQEGFDFELAKENIGNALRSFVFEYLITNKYECYDFLAGVTRHKLNWSDATLRDVTISIGRNSLRGTLAYHGPRAIEQAKDRLRPIRDRLLKRKAAEAVADHAAGNETP